MRGVGRGEVRGGGGERGDIKQITAHSNPYSSFSLSFCPLCIRRGFDKKFSTWLCRTNTLAHFMLFCVEQSTMLPYAKYSIFIQVKYFYLFFLQKKPGYKKSLKYVLILTDSLNCCTCVLYTQINNLAPVSNVNASIKIPMKSI
jgi:hypothetical protein